ncbi:hypothetical protein LTR92_007331 [Exophiala xenobiotica]|nr:hypothetical protein LTR92_007331 [Exophiala xenobiotica]KAK5322009.1 hypothetical protein LTR93_006247 [Exophiala xenobiotica]
MAYKFVTLTPSQIDQRRHELDLVGWQAWLSPIVLLWVIYMYRRILSPFVFVFTSKADRLSNSSVIRVLRFRNVLPGRRMSWGLGHTYLREFGPLSVQIVGGVYLGWLLFLIFRHTGEDYMHLTKAFGHVAVSQLPLHYLLSVKSGSSSSSSFARRFSFGFGFPVGLVSVATGLSHERLNAYHRLLGRMVHGLLGVHAVMYIRFFVGMGVLQKRIGHWDVRLGLAAFWTVNLLGLLSLPVVRRRWYFGGFYRSHVVLSGPLPVLVYWHVPYRSVRWFAVQMGVIWVVAGLMRWQGSEMVGRVRCEEVEGTGGQLVRVRMAVPRGSALARAMPGQHVYVHRSVGGGRGRVLEVKAKNPFTIVRVVRDDAAEDGKQEGTGTDTGTEVVLVVRNLGGPGTDWIAEMARTGEIAEEVSVEGPYGEAGEYMGNMLRPSAARGPVLLVAGGVGATYTIPIYMALLDSERLGQGKRRKLKMIWVVRTLADAAWGIEILQSRNGDGDGDGDGDVEVDVDVFVTGIDGLILSDGEKVPAAAMPGLKIHSLGKRPNLESVIDGFFATSAASTVNELQGERPTDADVDVDDEVAVFVCGPPSLSNDLRELVGRHVNEKGRRVKWIEEVFGFGGS